MSIEQQITIISAIYPPEPQVSARMAFDLANYLAAQGHCVTVVCPQPSRPLSAEYSQFKCADKPVVTNENGIKLVRLPSFTAPESRMIPRMRESFSFGREVTKYLAAEQIRPAVLYVNSWPLFAQALIALFAKKNGIPIVLQIMDIYPEALIRKLPTFLRSVIYMPLQRLDAWIARSAAQVVVIAESMRRTYTDNRKLSIDSVVIIPTWQDETVFENVPPRSECCARYGIPSLFTFLYLGNIGPVAGVDLLISAFARADISDAQLVVVGDGTAKSDCVEQVKRLNLSRVHFISDPDIGNVPVLQGMANVCVLPMKSGAGMSSIPSKLPSYLFSGKPIIATVDLESDTARFVRQAECGWVGVAGDSFWLADKMTEVARLPMEQLDAIGRQGKEFGLAHFSKSKGVVRLADTILKATGVNI